MKDIKSNQIKQTNIQQLKSIDQYDMYIVEFELLKGETKKIKVFTEKNTFPIIGTKEWEDIENKYYKELYVFFVDRLIGMNSLLKKQNRDDYIYLGGNFRQDYIADRYIMQKNGKTGQKNFDANLFGLKMKVEIREKIGKEINSFENKAKGKHYVISDIHGMYGSYKAAVKKLKREDELYVLGDVIDRGNNGIKIIQDLIRMKNNPQSNPKINFLLGNHEWQFLSVLKIMNDKNLTEEDIVTMYLWKNYSAFLGNAELDNNQDDIEKYTKKFNDIDEDYKKIQNSKNVKNSDRDYLYRWLYNNKGLQTMIDYFELPEKEKKNLYDFLYNSNVVMTEQIKGQEYLFVHAVPPNDSNMLNAMKQNKKSFKYSELDWFNRKYMLETRDDNSSYKLAKANGFITICGHDPSIGRIVDNEDYNYIRIDAGCGHGIKQRKSKVKLAVYCIEDDKVRYIDEMQEVCDYR